MQQISLIDLADAAKRTPAPLIAVAALGAVIEPERFEELLAAGLELHEVVTWTGSSLYVCARELVAYMLAPLIGEASSGERVN